MADMKKDLRREVGGYVTGFILSIIITLFAYTAVTDDYASGDTLIMLLAGLGLAQVIVQLVFFLKLGRESGPKWRLAAFASMLVVLLIVVGGSLWIMHHLDYNMMHMSESEQQKRIDKESGF